jgi:hypothetical protein
VVVELLLDKIDNPSRQRLSLCEKMCGAEIRYSFLRLLISAPEKRNDSNDLEEISFHLLQTLKSV